MELKTRDGLTLLSEDELKQLHEVAHFIPVARRAVSKAWRLLDKLDKMLLKIGGESDKRDNSVHKT